MRGRCIKEKGMNGLRTFIDAVNKTNVFMGKLMVGVTIFAVFVITFEVVMRYLFGMPTNWGHETMILMFAIFYCAAAGYCHYYRAHVRVDVIYASRSPRTKAILDIITSVFFFMFVGVFTYTSWNFYWSSQTMQAGTSVLGIPISGEVSFTDWGPPYYPVKFMMPLGGFLLLLQGIVWLIRDIHMVATGREMK
jgi:TRAP-type mannitol/chloroaromatic compound transport system permease small subunit